ncbi:MAG: PcfB family protein [Lachnospiraceae bacterium]|nr:PcfB family protein [Lachnospiraceae bacterium]
MQEEIENKAVALNIKAAKLTTSVLKAALIKALAEMEKQRKNPKIHKGRQSVKHLVWQGAGVSNIEITDGNIKSFEKVARKYGIDFALKKDSSTQPPRYLVFFKSRDADALTAAFREYSGRVVKDTFREKPSIRRQLAKLQEVVKDMAKSISRNKHQEVDRS